MHKDTSKTRSVCNTYQNQIKAINTDMGPSLFIIKVQKCEFHKPCSSFLCFGKFKEMVEIGPKERLYVSQLKRTLGPEVILDFETPLSS